MMGQEWGRELLGRLHDDDGCDRTAQMPSKKNGWRHIFRGSHPPGIGLALAGLISERGEEQKSVWRLLVNTVKISDKLSKRGESGVKGSARTGPKACLRFPMLVQSAM